MKPVVVGIDDSQSAVAALAWSVNYASAVGSPVVAVTAWQRPQIVGRAATLPELAQAEDRREAIERHLRELADGVVGSDHVQTRVKAVEGHPVDVLVEQSRRARLLVVGARGVGGFHRMLLGSVSNGVVHHAHCPVVVTRGTYAAAASGQRVVVGVDGSEAANVALGWASHFVRTVGGTLTVVGAWDWPSFQEVPIMYGTWDPKGSAKEIVEAAASATGLPDPTVATVVAKGHPAKVLLDNAADADLLVVGSRGLGGFAGLALGSVGVNCVNHAACPVAVIRSADSQPRGTAAPDRRETHTRG